MSAAAAAAEIVASILVEVEVALLFVFLYNYYTTPVYPYTAIQSYFMVPLFVLHASVILTLFHL